jgi:hypothetical protein
MKLTKLSHCLIVIPALLAGCSHVLQPQSFVKDPSKGTATVLNNNWNNEFAYYIKYVNGNWVGDRTYGSIGINEILAEAGPQKLSVVANFLTDSTWANAYQKTFTGTIECDLKEGKFYTIAPSENGTPVGESIVNYIPIIAVGQFIAGGKIISVNGQLKLACIEYAEKPNNAHISKLINEQGYRVSTEFFTPH